MAAPSGCIFFRLLAKSTRKLLSCKITSRNNERFHSNWKEIKKFYKRATISQANDGFEINLDERKLKTLNGHLFHCPSEALALAVATEWNSQQETIKRHSMYLTLLCNAAIDNPTQRKIDDIITAIVHYLQTDTLRYRVVEPEALVDMQRKQWDPVVEWFQERYGVIVDPVMSMLTPEIEPQTADILRSHLSSYSHWALQGMSAAVDVLRSLILTLAVVDKCVSVDTAVKLSLLETEFQTQHWGTVEWYHDIDFHESRSRLAAAALFIHFCTESSSVKIKTTR